MNKQFLRAILLATRGMLSIALMTLLICTVAIHVYAQAPIQISIAPLAIELSGERGQTVPFSLTIVNNSRFETARFRAYATGLREGRSGEYGLKTPDDGPYAASSWVRLEHDEFEVGPGNNFVLRGTVNIPRDARPSGYAAVVIELLPEEAIGPAAFSTEYVQQFAAALEIVVGRRHVRSAHIESMTVIPASAVPELAATYGDSAVLFIGTVINDGDVHVTGRGTLILRDERGRRIREVPLGGGRGVILPDTVVDFGSVLGGLAPGKYEMQAIVEYGGSRPAIGRMEFELSDEAVGIAGAIAGRPVRMDAGPTLLMYEFPRSAYRAQTITVVNRDFVDVDFTVTLEELVNDEDGQPLRADSDVVMPYSAVAWGEVRPVEFTLRPGQRRNVVVGFRAPDGENGGRYARVRIEGRTPAPEPGMEPAFSEITVDALLMLGSGFTSRMEVAELEWRPIGDTGRVSVGATVTNTGDIHGTTGMRVNLFEFVPAAEEDMGDFVFVRDEEWRVVDSVEVEASDVVMLPGEGRFMFVMFGQAMERNKQYQALVEVLGEGGRRDDTAELYLWVDSEGRIHEGVSEELMGVSEE